MHDPAFWQPLRSTSSSPRTASPFPGRVQSFIGAKWGHVRGFALPALERKGLPIDPGKPPFGTADTASYKQQAVEVIRASAELDANDRTTIDIGPGLAATTRSERTTATATSSTRPPASRMPPTSSAAPTSPAS